MGPIPYHNKQKKKKKPPSREKNSYPPHQPCDLPPLHIITTSGKVGKSALPATQEGNVGTPASQEASHHHRTTTLAARGKQQKIPSSTKVSHPWPRVKKKHGNNNTPGISSSTTQDEKREGGAADGLHIQKILLSVIHDLCAVHEGAVFAHRRQKRGRE